MMHESTVTPMMQGLSTSSNNGDDWDPVVDRNIMLEKNRELKKSKYIHSTLVDGTGIIIQFINSQGAFAQGAGEVFGGVRINLSDPEKVPNYIDKYESTIRSHARIQLEEHLNRANHPGGLHETLSDEDFGLTIAWGTLSSIGRKASPSSRGEGPVWYGIYPTLIEPINVSRDPSQPQDWTHVLNCYVNLANKQGRRSYLRQLPPPNNENKDPGKVATKRQNQDRDNTPSFRGGRGGYANQGFVKRPRQKDERDPIDEKERVVEIIETTIEKYNQKHAPERMFPGLPTSAGDPSPKWEKKGLPEFPDY